MSQSKQKYDFTQTQIVGQLLTGQAQMQLHYTVFFYKYINFYDCQGFVFIVLK